MIIRNVALSQQSLVLEEPKDILGGASLSARVSYSSNGFIVVSGTRDGIVKLWEVHSGELYRSFEASDQILALDIVTTLRSGISDGFLKVQYNNYFNNFIGIHKYNFITQFDFLPQLTTDSSHLVLSIQRSSPDDSSLINYHFDLGLSEGDWALVADGETLDQGSTSMVSTDSWFTLTIMALDDQVAILINDQPITYIKNDSHMDPEAFTGHHEIALDSSSGFTILLVDNYRFWDLDQIDLSSYGIN